jgi:hypothetical protein
MISMRTACSFVFMAIFLAACRAEPTVFYSDITVAVVPTTPAPVTATLSGYPPPPPPFTPPTPYPVQAPTVTVGPTLAPAAVTAFEQTQVAAATASTFPRLETQTAEAALIPTTASKATRTPAALPTAPITPVPMRMVVTSKPSCTAASNTTTCHDAVLAMHYAYPSTWGTISAKFFTGGYSGYGYDYSFSNNSYSAGGRSQDFSEGRESFLTDFGGFGSVASETNKNCKHFGAFCDLAQPNVWITMITPSAADECFSNTPDPNAFYGMVAIDLPTNPKINGFLFISPLVSLSLMKRYKLDTILGSTKAQREAACEDSALTKQFDVAVAQIVAIVRARTGDNETQAHYNQLLGLAQSIRFD